MRVELDWRVARRSAAAAALAWRAAALVVSFLVREAILEGSEASEVSSVRRASWRHWDFVEGVVLFRQRPPAPPPPRPWWLEESESSLPPPRARAVPAAERTRRERNFMVVGGGGFGGGDGDWYGRLSRAGENS